MPAGIPYLHWFSKDGNRGLKGRAAGTGAGIDEQGKVMRMVAAAKINLGLKVLNRRPDGYHNLESVMQQVSLADYLTFERVSSPAGNLNQPPPAWRMITWFAGRPVLGEASWSKPRE